jgi:hypothetical protein
MAKSLTKPAFGAPSPETLAAIEAEDKAAELRRAVNEYEAKRRDLERKFETALATLREQYLAQVLEIHGGAAYAETRDRHGRRVQYGIRNGGVERYPGMENRPVYERKGAR